MSCSIRTVLVAGLVLAACGSSPVSADGVKEIHPLCVQTGCFDGDTPGFPVQITQPGSYRLTGNLDVSGQPSATDVDGIWINSADVELDLNGYSVRGPVSCTFNGSGVGCSVPEGTGDGIRIFERGVTVRGGAVSGMGRYGVWCDTDAQCLVQDMVVSNNASIGMVLFQSSATVLRSRVFLNRTSGIAANGRGVIIKDSEAFENGGSGIETSSGIVVDSAIYDNVLFGVSASNGLVSGNRINDNLAAGLVCNSCNAQDNVIVDNGGSGIQIVIGDAIGGGNLLRGNAAGDLQGSFAVESAPNLCGSGPC